MRTADIVIALTLLALAVIPVMVWYSLWLDRTVLPTVLRLTTLLARAALPVPIALLWTVIAFIV